MGVNHLSPCAGYLNFIILGEILFGHVGVNHLSPCRVNLNFIILGEILGWGAIIFHVQAKSEF